MPKAVSIFVFATLFVLGALVLTSSLLYRNALPPQQTQSVTLTHENDPLVMLRPEVVKGTDVETGLMNRSKAPKDGMLFDFGSPAPQSFTMFHTDVPLTAVWLDKDFHILSTTQMTPCPAWKLVFCPTYESPEPVQYVLEVAPGTVKDIEYVRN